MGLLMFKERSPEDKTPFRRNEFHVKDGVSLVANVNQSQTIDGRIARTSPSSANASRDRQRQGSRPSRQANRSSRNGRLRSSLINWLSRRNVEESAEHALQGRMFHDDSDTDIVPDDVSITSSEFDELHQAMLSEANTRPQNVADNADPPATNFRIRSGPSRHFAPARQYYEEQRAQYFDVTSARGRAQTSGSRSGSIGAINRRRAASPETELAILRELRRQEVTENRSGLYLDGAADTSSRVPRMTISHADGLGDRRRSPSPADDNTYGNGSEENWNELTDSIPIIDANLPSAGSSFASDGASSILSRAAGRSSFTNTPVSDGRAGSADNGPVRQQDYYAHYCPEGNLEQPGHLLTRVASHRSYGPPNFNPSDPVNWPPHVLASARAEIAARREPSAYDREASQAEEDGEMATAQYEASAPAYTHAPWTRGNSSSRARSSRLPPSQSHPHPHALLRPITTTSTRRNSNPNAHANSEHPTDSPRLSHSSTDLSSLDELLDMMNNGTEVPPEMWTAIGITPHLAGLRLRSRSARRSTRVIRGE